MRDVEISIQTRHSYVHLGSLDSFDITEGGKSAGRKILQYLSVKKQKPTPKVLIMRQTKRLPQKLQSVRNFLL